MAITSADIQNYLAANPGMTDAQIASAMHQYGVTPEQMAQATNVAMPEVQARYDAATSQLNNQQIANRAQQILAAGGNEYDIAREANLYNLSAKDLAGALNMSPEKVQQLSGGLLDSRTPSRPTFSGVAAEWNTAHAAKYGTPLNLALTSQDAVQQQVRQLQEETSRQQSEWDKLYGNTPEGKIIKENPPPDWRQIYEPWSQSHLSQFGKIIDRPWSTDEATINQKRDLDQKYIQAVNDYNKKYGTNIAPDPMALGTLAQPNEIFKAPEKSKWYENPLNLAALIAATYFGAPFFAESLGAGGMAGGTGLTAGAGGVTGLTAGAGGATGLLAPAGFTLAPELGAGLLVASTVAPGTPSIPNIPTVPSAYETAVKTALGQTTEIGTFGQAGTAGFGSALPSAAETAAALEAAGFAPGTAANLAGTTSAGVGATNLLGGATAANPLVAQPGISPTDALRAANTIRQLTEGQQQQKSQEQQAGQMAAGAVDYSGLLNLLASKANTSGLLGTQFQPQSFNLASLLG